MIEKPNILYLHSHDTGRWISPYGYAVRTPNLQRFAEQGVLFRNAHCAAPTCSPSRAALLTGMTPHRTGMMGLAHIGFSLNDPKRLLTHALKSAGYATAIAGVTHVAAYTDRPGLGYDYWLNHRSPGEGDSEKTTAAACAFLRAPPTEPFFLDIGYNETHRLAHGWFSHNATGPIGDPRLARPMPHLPDRPAIRADSADFAEAAHRLDNYYGQVLAALDASGAADRTLIICTTDHGPAFPGAKCNVTDAGTGVLLILRGPHGFSGGKVFESMVSHLDIFPTLCDLIGLDADSLDGQSLLPLLRGEKEELHDALFAEVNYHVCYEPQRSVRTSRWKYIRRFDDRQSEVAPNIDDSISKLDLFRRGWHRRPRPKEMLFDLIFDPTESHNLAPDPAAQPILQEMRARLAAWMRQTADPLLHGPVPLPPGAIPADPAAYSPDGGPWPADLVRW
jgi:N-sulfoglucosamine sulfohydrolase